MPLDQPLALVPSRRTTSMTRAPRPERWSKRCDGSASGLRDADRDRSIGRTRPDVHVVHEFPFSRRFRAFDLAVSASGYNSFHELLRFGIPTLFIPNRNTALDDQRARARFAADTGLAHVSSGSAWPP